MPARLARLLLRPAARYSSRSTSLRQLSQATTAAEAETDLITRLHLRVGRILAVEPHPAADKLFIETIDIGKKKESADEQGAVAQTPEPVTIVSGLRPYYEAQELENRDVVVAVNMKPTNFRGVRSAGMLLAAYKDDVVEVLEPPLGSAPGDLVFVAGVPKGQGGVMQTTIIGEMYPASRKPAQDLTPVSLRDLKLETQHQGRVLIVKTVCEASRLTGVQTVVVDENGAAERLGVYNFPATVAATEICPENAVFAIKEPYLKQSADGGVTIRVDHPSDLVVLDKDSPLIPLQWKSEIPQKSALDLKAQGNLAFKNADWIRAEKCYTAALQANTNGDAQLTHTLYRNRSGARIRLGRFELARSDALLSVLQPVDADEGEVAQGNLKAYFRAGRASYELGEYSKAKEFYTMARKIRFDDKDALAEALRAERRLREEASGSLNFATMHRELLDNQRLDHASFLRNTTVSECEHGRGLFAAADVRDYHYDIQFQHVAASNGLASVALLALIDKVQHNAGQAEAYFDLFDGNRFGDKHITVIDERVVVDTFQVQGIAELNAFGTAKTDEEESTSGSTGIWLRASRANHSCLANAHWAFIGDFMLVRANVDIKAGEQGFLSYGTLLKSVAGRRKFHDHYGFRCRCLLCQAESKVPAQISDKRARLAREAVAFSKEHPRTLKSAAHPTSTALLKEATRLQQELERTYDDKLFARLPRFDCVTIDFWICQSGCGIGANVSSRNAMRVLRDLGFFFDQHGKVLAYGLSEERAIHACVHAANAYEAMGQTGKARVLLALAKEVYTIDRGDLTGFEENFGR
ncbi:hypothetical protein HDU89_002497 [Geranomyces variabilis]|nr:hypothetical protein HDU89_002497 [Geranomyces variabilis]